MENLEQQSLLDDGSNYWDDNQNENFEEWYENYLYENSCDLAYEKRCDEMLNTPIDIQLLLLQSSATNGANLLMGVNDGNVGGDDGQYCDPLSCEYLEMDMGEPDWGVFGENIPPSC